jgi:hypothetical protein
MVGYGGSVPQEREGGNDRAGNLAVPFKNTFGRGNSVKTWNLWGE